MLTAAGKEQLFGTPRAYGQRPSAAAQVGAPGGLAFARGLWSDPERPPEVRIGGTVLVDVGSRRPVDLLPDRDASGLAAWLAKRPGVKVVCRDRAPFFAERCHCRGTAGGAIICLRKLRTSF